MAPETPTHGPGLFVTTRWSVILAAQETGSPERTAALDTLCRAYWHPIYVFVRQQGFGPHDAQDLTQEFIARLLEKNYLKAADKEKGRFRTFLRVALKRFLANEWDRTRAAKRGSGQAALPLDLVAAEGRYEANLQSEASPDRNYDYQWAMALLEQTLAQLRRDYEVQGNASEFEQLKECLTADRGAIPYPALAASLTMGEGAVRVAVHRLRRRFRALFRAMVANTLAAEASAEELDEELKYIAGLLSRC